MSECGHPTRGGTRLRIRFSPPGHGRPDPSPPRDRPRTVTPAAPPPPRAPTTAAAAVPAAAAAGAPPPPRPRSGTAGAPGHSRDGGAAGTFRPAPSPCASVAEEVPGASSAALRPCGCRASTNSSSAWRGLSSCDQLPAGPLTVTVEPSRPLTSSTTRLGPASCSCRPTRTSQPPGSGSTVHMPQRRQPQRPGLGRLGQRHPVLRRQTRHRRDPAVRVHGQRPPAEPRQHRRRDRPQPFQRQADGGCAAPPPRAGRPRSPARASSGGRWAPDR